MAKKIGMWRSEPCLLPDLWAYMLLLATLFFSRNASDSVSANQQAAADYPAILEQGSGDLRGRGLGGTQSWAAAVLNEGPETRREPHLCLQMGGGHEAR